MGTRYIQAAVSDKEYETFKRFAFDYKLTLSELIEVAVVSYISNKRKEEEAENRKLRMNQSG